MSRTGLFVVKFCLSVCLTNTVLQTQAQTGLDLRYRNYQVVKAVMDKPSEEEFGKLMVAEFNQDFPLEPTETVIKEFGREAPRPQGIRPAPNSLRIDFQTNSVQKPERIIDSLLNSVNGESQFEIAFVSMTSDEREIYLSGKPERNELTYRIVARNPKNNRIIYAFTKGKPSANVYKFLVFNQTYGHKVEQRAAEKEENALVQRAHNINEKAFEEFRNGKCGHLWKKDQELIDSLGHLGLKEISGGFPNKCHGTKNFSDFKRLNADTKKICSRQCDFVSNKNPRQVDCYAFCDAEAKFAHDTAIASFNETVSSAKAVVNGVQGNGNTKVAR